MAAEKLTPMMRQYRQLKEKYADCFLFFRLGDFYEMFFEDAVLGAKLLNLTLTKRQTTPMCGVPHHAVESYLGRLTRLGKKVAICEQLSDPSLPGIVQRDVIRVITPGTTFDERILSDKANHFIISVVLLDQKRGLAVCDLTTGLFQVASFAGDEDLTNEIFRLNPAECVVDASEQNLPPFLRQFEKLPVFPHQCWDSPRELLAKHFGVKDLRGFGIENQEEIVGAAALLLHYLKETQKSGLEHLHPPQLINHAHELVLDETAIRNLELLAGMRDGGREGSLIGVLDATKTSMGGRTLRQWLLHPVRSKKDIEARLDAVSEIQESLALKTKLPELLSAVLDMERLLARMATTGGGARDLLGIGLSLKILEPLKEILSTAKCAVLKDVYRQLDNLQTLPRLRDKILATLVDAPPLSVREGGLIRDGVHGELDELRTISRSAKHFIQELQQSEIKKTGIQSLKIRYNQVFGYYIEVTKANLDRVPENYFRKQTLVNCERFITPELKEYEEKILGAESKMQELEYQIFVKIREETKEHTREIQSAAQLIGILDGLLSLALIAEKNRYVRPDIEDAGGILQITGGRHPVVEKLGETQFVANDTKLDAKQSLMLLTGPNMGGKSTYLRQTALIALLAHMGSFVPAQKAHIPLLDRIFTRVGASDNLVRGQSTFMVEMQETAQILHYATENSLIILDEIGRGTSTYDGVSLAWAILEHIHDHVGAKTLFATHYHELISVVEKLPRAVNCSVAVAEEKGSIAFLYRVRSGAVDRSYGIEVAKLAGLPKEVVEKAKTILNDLEEGVLDQAIATRVQTEKPDEHQLEMFKDRPHRVLEEIKNVDINELTPLAALEKLNEWKKRC